MPQETKLGVILFTLMTNNPLADWHPRVKFVDDTSVIEMLPRNSISLLNSTVSDIHNFSMDQNMRLNPIKCKEMLINSMLYPNFTLIPLLVGNNDTERVSTYKILGVFLDNDLRRNSHVDYIYKKAFERFYSLPILRQAGVDHGSMLKASTSSVSRVRRACVAIHSRLSVSKIESIRKRALKIIFPCADSYSDALELVRGWRPLRVEEIRYV